MECLCVCVCVCIYIFQLMLCYLRSFLCYKRHYFFSWLLDNAKKCLKRKNNGVRVCFTKYENILLQIINLWNGNRNRLLRNLEIHHQYKWELNIWGKKNISYLYEKDVTFAMHLVISKIIPQSLILHENKLQMN